MKRDRRWLHGEERDYTKDKEKNEANNKEKVEEIKDKVSYKTKDEEKKMK